MGVFRALGLVPAARLVEAVERLRKSESRVESLSRKLEEALTESRALRAKLEEAHRRLKDAEDNASREAQRFHKSKADAQRQAARERKRAVDAPALESRLDDAERDLTVAREHLMAIEVKLDILEGAATVLDSRTRTLLAQPVDGKRSAS